MTNNSEWFTPKRPVKEIKVDLTVPLLLITAILLVLKLTVLHSLSWWIVFSPIWLFVGSGLAVLLTVVIFALITRPGNVTLRLGKRSWKV